MTRSPGAVAILLLALLPPTAVAAPTSVRAAAARAVVPFEAPLSANVASDRALIAFHHAPLHHQEVDRTGKNGLKGRADYVTRVDFDGDWDARNDWENTARFALPGAAYHSVVETKSHWFVVYMFFHPRDWAHSIFDTEHENDSEGVLIVVRRDGSKFGRLEAAVTVAHSDFYSFVPRRGAWSAGAESVDGVLELDARSGRAMTMQEAGGHALRAYRRDSAIDGVVYVPSLAASSEPASGARTATYVLVDAFEPGGLWLRRNEPKLFAKSGTFAGDRGGTCGEGGVLCTANAANAPWGWNDGDDGDVARGELATDPAKLVTRYFRTPETVSRAYVYNPYKPDTSSGPRRDPRLLVARGR